MNVKSYYSVHADDQILPINQDVWLMIILDLCENGSDVSGKVWDFEGLKNQIWG